MLQKIKELVEIETKIRDISKKSRLPDIVDARVMYYYLAKKYTGFSYQRIAKQVNRDHATALHAMKSYNNWNFASLQYRKQLAKLHSIEQLVPEIKEEDIQPVDFHELFRARNIALNLQITKLLKEMKEKDAEIKRLSSWRTV
jgi:hypothetical protein